MNILRTRSSLAAMALLTLALAAPARADEPRSPGPGMMGGDGPGMTEGYGPGYGPHHGWGGGMRGWGGGSGGMMGGYGPGMMGLGPLHALNLSNEQLAKVNQIRDEVRRKNWEVMGKLMDEQTRMRDLMGAEKRDPSAIGKQSMKVADLRRQMLENMVDAHNRVEALLSKEQRDQLRSYRRGRMMQDD